MIVYQSCPVMSNRNVKRVDMEGKMRRNLNVENDLCVMPSEAASAGDVSLAQVST